MVFRNFTDFIIKTKPPINVLARLDLLRELTEDDEYHPEANVFEHIKIVTERLIPIMDINLIMTGCLHDLFKHDAKRFSDTGDAYTCFGHEVLAANFIQTNREIRDWITRFGGDVDLVENLCRDHMRIHYLDEMRPAKRNRLVGSTHFKKLSIFTLADDMRSDFDPRPYMTKR